MDDGLNELILVRAPKGLPDYNAIVGAVIARDFRPDHFIILQADSVTLDFDEPVSWTLDGEYGGDTDHALVVNIPKPIEIMVPQGD